jgi:hypothetical protein
METMFEISKFFVPINVTDTAKASLMLRLALLDYSVTFTQYNNGTIVTIVR